MLVASTWCDLQRMATKLFGSNRVLLRWCLCGDIHQLPVVGGTSVFDLGSFRAFLRTPNFHFLALVEIERCKYKDAATGVILTDQDQAAILQVADSGVQLRGLDLVSARRRARTEPSLGSCFPGGG